MGESFDWRGYARSKNIEVWRVWLALRESTAEVRVPSDGVHVRRPTDVDVLCGSEEGRVLVRATIDGLPKGK